MKWVTRARPKTDRIACPWLIRRFIDPDAEILYVPRTTSSPSPAKRRHTASTHPAPSSTTATASAPSRCSSTTSTSAPIPALVRLAAVVHAADIDDQLHTDALGPGLLAIGLGGLDVEADDHRLLERASFVYDALYAWSARHVEDASRDRAPRLRGHPCRHRPPGRQADGRRRDHRAEVRWPAVPPGQAPLRRDGHRRRRRHLQQLADWIRARGKERREAIWFRDADVAEAVDAVLFVGLADWYPPNYDCGACGYATCAEFLHATKPLRDDSHDLEFVGPTCNLRDIDLGIAVGSAAKTAAIHSIDCRCQTRVAVAARKLGVINADLAVALSLSMTHKAVGFDRKIGEVDFDALDLPSTGTLPIGVDGTPRADGARNRQRPGRRSDPPACRDQQGTAAHATRQLPLTGGVLDRLHDLGVHGVHRGIGDRSAADGSPRRV